MLNILHAINWRIYI